MTTDADLIRLLHQHYLTTGDTIARKAAWRLEELRAQVPVGLFWQTADGRWHFSPGSTDRGDIHDNGRPIHVALLGEEAK